MDRNELNQMSASYLNVTAEGVSFWAAGLWDRLRIPPVARRGSNANPCVVGAFAGRVDCEPDPVLFLRETKVSFRNLIK